LNLANQIGTIRIKAGVAAGTSDITSDIVDLANTDGVLFTVLLGALTSGHVTTITVEHGDAANLSDAETVTGSSTGALADGAADKVVQIEMTQPTKRYARIKVDRGTQNAVVDGILAQTFGHRKLPLTKDSTVHLQTILQSP
jgi:hypothetical protein